MLCASCTKENPADAAFCAACGTRLEPEALPVFGGGRYRAVRCEGGRKRVWVATGEVGEVGDQTVVVGHRILAPSAEQE